MPHAISDDRNKQNDYLSAMKMIATILVVYVHSENIFRYAGVTDFVVFRRILSTFNATAVPVFYLISGYLLFRKSFDYRTNIIKKCHSLLVPFLFWNTIWFVLEMIVFIFIPAYSEIHDWSFGGLLVSYFGIPMGGYPPIYAPLWFVRDLFVINLFSWIVKKVFDHINRWVILFALFILWLSPISNQARQPICFFCLGGLFAYNKIKFSLHKPVFVAVISGIVGLMIPCWSTNIYMTRSAILFCVASIMMWISIFKNIQKFFVKLIPFSFPIYVIHGKVISVIQIVIVKLVSQTSLSIVLEYILLPIFVMAICVLVSILFSHFCPTWYVLAMGNRYELKKDKKGDTDTFVFS